MTSYRSLLGAVAATVALALSSAAPVMAEDHPAVIHVHDAYARVSGKGRTGAAFFMMHNMTEADDRLLDVKSDIAQRTEIHTHKDMGDGVMSMIHVTEGLPLAAGEMHELARGGDHVMMMGLTADLKDGDHFPMTLVFEKAGTMVIEVEVDNDREAGEMMQHDGQGHMDHSHGMKSGS